MYVIRLILVCQNASISENVAYEFLFTFLAVLRMSGPYYLDGLWDESQVATQVLFLWYAASRIGSKQYVAVLCSSHRAFSLRVMFSGATML